MKRMRLKPEWNARFGALLLYITIILGVILVNARIEYLNQVIK